MRKHSKILFLPTDKNGRKVDRQRDPSQHSGKDSERTFNKMIIPHPNPITVPSSFFCLTEAPNINTTSAARSTTTTDSRRAFRNCSEYKKKCNPD